MKGLDLPAMITPHYLPETTSTNDIAKKLGRERAPGFTLVYADRQSAGRGRMNREWQSPTGNLYMSLLLRPEPSWPALPTLSHVTALAIRDAVSSLLSEKVIKLKWPNDVLIEDAKLSGILIEHEDEVLIVGVGVNITHHPEDLPYPATSLVKAGARTDRDRFLSKLVTAFLARFGTWKEHGFVGLQQDYLDAAHRLKETITVRSGVSDNVVTGIYDGIDENGQLLLKLESGKQQIISAGDVLAT